MTTRTFVQLAARLAEHLAADSSLRRRMLQRVQQDRSLADPQPRTEPSDPIDFEQSEFHADLIA